MTTSPRIIPTLLIAMLASAGCTGGGGVPSTAPPSGATQVGFPAQLPAPGTQWVYALTFTDTASRSGTLMMTYLGQQSFHGATYYSMQTQDSLQAPTYIVSYLQPTSSGFSEFGATLNQAPFPPPCQFTDQAEDTLDVARSFYGATANVSGNETRTSCLGAPSTAPYTIGVSDLGESTRAVPAGTFVVHGWQTTFVTFGQTFQFTSYQTGSTVIEREATAFFSNGNVAWTSTAKLQSGPINVLFPGPPTISEQGY